MSINWVMTCPESPGFIKLPHERILYTSPARTSFELTALPKTSQAQTLALKSEAGVAFVTTHRLVYLPATPTPEFRSFSSPILSLQDTYVRTPLFGPNAWIGLCEPVAAGGIPPTHSAVDLKLTFRDGGAFDFQCSFEQIKETSHQVLSVTEEASSTHDLYLSNVDLEPLPAYKLEREDDGLQLSNSAPLEPRGNVTLDVNNLLGNEHASLVPGEAPPRYEEAQAQAVNIDSEQRLRENY